MRSHTLQTSSVGTSEKEEEVDYLNPRVLLVWHGYLRQPFEQTRLAVCDLE